MHRTENKKTCTADISTSHHAQTNAPPHLPSCPLTIHVANAANAERGAPIMLIVAPQARAKRVRDGFQEPSGRGPDSHCRQRSAQRQLQETPGGALEPRTMNMCLWM